MGSSESKMSVATTPKIDPKLARVSHVDPRSPSCAIIRTPIQVGATYSPLPVVESIGPVSVDPRSPTPGITRTPIKVSVSSLARRLSRFFLVEVKSGDSPLPPVSYTKPPCLPTVDQPPATPFTDRPSEPMSTLTTISQSEHYDSICSSPFVLVEDALIEVDADAEQSLEEGEEALLLGVSPLTKKLSLSLLACRDGVYSSSMEDRPLTPIPPLKKQLKADHSYAQFSIPPQSTESLSEEEDDVVATVDADVATVDADVATVDADVATVDADVATVDAVVATVDDVVATVDDVVATVDDVVATVDDVVATVDDVVATVDADVATVGADMVTVEDVVANVEADVSSQTDKEQVPEASPVEVTPKPAVVLSKSSPLIGAVQPGFHVPKFDTRSPSQVVFKPQWLGVGFGASGVRTRGAQGRGRSVYSPRSSKKPVSNENNNMVVGSKTKPRDKVVIGEGRSPLLVLKDTNSPRERNPQMKLKTSTPDKPRFGAIDRRALILSLKE